MTRILVGMLVILLAYGYTDAYIKFSDIKTIIQWIDYIFIKSIQYYDSVNSLTSTDSEKIDQSLKKLNEISSELRSFARSTEIKLDQMLSTLLINLRMGVLLQLLKKDLTDHLNTVMRFYNDAINYGSDNKTYTIDTLKNFAHLVLSTSENLPSILQKIHQVFTNQGREGYLQLVLYDTVDNLPTDCNKHISAQQELYYTYISVVLAEIQGFDVLNQVYLIKQIFEKDHYNYTNELTQAKNRSEIRLADYNNIMSRYSPHLPREIRRCDVNPPRRNKNFIEFEDFARAQVLPEFLLLNEIERHKSRAVYFPCGSQCHKIIPDGPEKYYSRRLTKCEYLGGEVRVCRADANSHRQYLWWKNQWGTYGHDEICDHEFVYPAGRFELTGTCQTCVCSSYFSDWRSTGKRQYVNLSPQLSDIENNMVVTGVQLVRDRNQISLRIQENKFLPGGIANNTGTWKTVSYEKYAHLVDFDRRSIYLDDIVVPDGYAVTGVQFELSEDPSGFQLQIHATPFDLNTGELKSGRSKWIEADDYGTPHLQDYDRHRLEIDMEDADDPTRGSVFTRDPETNKFIKFTHTSLRKDAGQTTIPLVETLPVESTPTFPLGGVGLTFKGRRGFGGYIAPRIFTIDVSKYFRTV